MSKLNLNELVALSLVLDSISVKDLLHNAMQGFSEDNTTQANDNANICSLAITTYLK